MATTVGLNLVNSRFKFSSLLEAEEVVFFDLLNIPDIEQQQTDSLYTVVQGDRLDKLAYTYYQDSKLWWIIAKANGIEDIFGDFGPGQELRIPNASYVLNTYLTQKVKNNAGL